MGGKRPGRGGAITPADKARFLAAYVESRYNFRAACEAIGRDRRAMYRQLERDDEFRNAFHELRQLVADDLLAEAYRRAVIGVDKPVYQGGELVGYVREYSDSLLAQMLRAFRGEFQERLSVDVQHTLDEHQLVARVQALLEAARLRRERGEVVEAEFSEPAQLPAPEIEDLL